MALKDQLNEALNAVPAENTRRTATLREVLAAAEAREGATDADIHAILSRIIGEREQRAASFNTAGQTELAKSEREEIGVLRGFLRNAPPLEASVAATNKMAEAVERPKSTGAGFTLTPKHLVIAGVVGGVLIIAAILYFFVFSSSPDDGIVFANSSLKGTIAVLKDDRTMGQRDAPIVLLEYAAPSCPHCGHFSVTEFPAIKKDYIDTGKVFYIFRVFPLGPVDGAVEAIARCLPADQYFPFIDLIFRRQSEWDPDGYNIADVHAAVIKMARTTGLGPEKADQCISDKDEQDRINAVAQDGETKYSIHRTPTFVVNGEVVQLPIGSEPGTILRARFDSLLAKP